MARIATDSQPPRLLECYFQPVDGDMELVEALQGLAKKMPLEQVPATLVLHGGEYSLQLMEAPQVEADERIDALRWKLQEIVDFDVQQAIIDLFDVPGQADRGRPPMVYAVVAQRALLQQKCGLLQQLNMQLETIDIPELTQRNHASLLPEDEQGVALLSFSRDQGLLTLTRQSSLYLARQLEVGYGALNLNAAEDDIDKEMQLVDFSSDMQRGMDQIVLEVQRSLDYYESHFGQAPINSLVIAPMAVEAPALRDYMAEQLGVQVRMFDVAEALNAETAMASSLQAHTWLAMGAALRQR